VGVYPRLAVRLKRPGLTGLTVPSTDLTGSSPYWVFAWVNISVCSLVSRFVVVAACFVLFGAQEVGFLDSGFLA
jgi:hypothetical protein